ncbi:hypothetical protein [Bordetella genomosp. 8]|nr:hypothetical protein [Bordetella genomosp. 8]
MKMKNLIFVALTLLNFNSASAALEAPDGIQRIGIHVIGTNGRPLKTCAFWANEAAAATKKRDAGVPQRDAEDAVPFPSMPTDIDAELHSGRVGVVAEVYEGDDLQTMSPKQVHDAVFAICKRNLDAARS